ncbi:hypothetical protein IMZ31_18930 (plasmid) [Pontibacillus sp. ALD_SL1]|uniref:hypothetical protein n=1 Tax=Pontibacillus sp. ALD_SL1 TaxID=2777185 RepID=UPI001A97018E|nr:hypothetical protein [Pontibacillus sp. ALD_SL1]QST02624.1 hypothetical protein IMZ31_18930 [Pontibacillus sp. ALD_SL1]
MAYRVILKDETHDIYLYLTVSADTLQEAIDIGVNEHGSPLPLVLYDAERIEKGILSKEWYEKETKREP